MAPVMAPVRCALPGVWALPDVEFVGVGGVVCRVPYVCCAAWSAVCARGPSVPLGTLAVVGDGAGVALDLAESARADASSGASMFDRECPDVAGWAVSSGGGPPIPVPRGILAEIGAEAGFRGWTAAFADGGTVAAGAAGAGGAAADGDAEVPVTAVGPVGVAETVVAAGRDTPGGASADTADVASLEGDRAGAAGWTGDGTLVRTVHGVECGIRVFRPVSVVAAVSATASVSNSATPISPAGSRLVMAGLRVPV
ncbi:hypothetical protein ACIRRA_37465 [Nocardia sp. NPDC101769]|uniref:hypothetical protein n=1 Tax=Nocardia sp. NPDC101769 TaxID=3364333 RepID=UPI003819E32C